MGSSGKGLGIVALLFAIGALGIGIYQIVFASPASGGASRTYITSNPNQLDFNLGGWRIRYCYVNLYSNLFCY